MPPKPTDFKLKIQMSQISGETSLQGLKTRYNDSINSGEQTNPPSTQPTTNASPNSNLLTVLRSAPHQYTALSPSSTAIPHSQHPSTTPDALSAFHTPPSLPPLKMKYAALSQPTVFPSWHRYHIMRITCPLSKARSRNASRSIS